MKLKFYISKFEADKICYEIFATFILSQLLHLYSFYRSFEEKSLHILFDVWSLDGPVPLDCVVPLWRPQSKLSVLSWVQPQRFVSKLQGNPAIDYKAYKGI